MILDRIVDAKREDLTVRRNRVPLAQLKVAVPMAPPVRDFAAALSNGEYLAIIAEHKRASPSKGLIRTDLRLADVMDSYVRGGAAAVSVLTEEHFFLGRNEDLREARRLVTLPVLRKDFLIDDYQIWESRALGSDAVLLIVSILSHTQLEHMLGLTRELGMEALVETHTPEELIRALAVGAKIIGINNRNLHTFHTELDTSIRLAKIVPADRILVAESGVRHDEDARRLAEAGVDAVLVGESVMRAAQPSSVVSSLAACRRKLNIRDIHPQVKVCGITRLVDGLEAADAGADMLGLVFAPSPRRVDEKFGIVLRKEVSARFPWVQLAGVFVNSSPADICHFVDVVGLNMVQLHGDESPAQVAELVERRRSNQHFRIYKAMSVLNETTVAAISAFEGLIDGALLDAPPVGEVRGGTGTSFDWHWASLARCRYPTLKIGVAGGLRAENVREVLRVGRPDLVDVSSGVEVIGQPGVKNPTLVQAFIAEVRSAAGSDE